MDETALQYLIDFHLSGDRQGPGGEKETQLAIKLAGINRTSPLKIADIGCGTGSSAILLAKELNADITAVDFSERFLDQLQKRAENHKVSYKISLLNASMNSLPFQKEEFDVIWSEGAVYSMGFQAGISYWNQFLKSGGILAVSEVTWLTQNRPDSIQSFWNNEYPEIGTASEKITILEKNGYSLKAYFVLPEHCWTDNYYTPMEARFSEFLAKHNHCKAAKNVVQEAKEEISLYSSYRKYFSYGFYIAKKL